MAITATELKRLQNEIAALKKRVAVLERSNGKPLTTTRRLKTAASPSRARAVNEHERAMEILQRAGMLAELDPELKQQAAAWRALSGQRKRQLTQTLQSLHLEPPLSQIIHANRR